MVCSRTIDNYDIKLVTARGNWSSALLGSSGRERRTGLSVSSVEGGGYFLTSSPLSLAQSCFQGHGLTSTSGLPCTQAQLALYTVTVSRLGGWQGRQGVLGRALTGQAC